MSFHVGVMFLQRLIPNGAPRPGAKLRVLTPLIDCHTDTLETRPEVRDRPLIPKLQLPTVLDLEFLITRNK